MAGAAIQLTRLLAVFGLAGMLASCDDPYGPAAFLKRYDLERTSAEQALVETAATAANSVLESVDGGWAFEFGGVTSTVPSPVPIVLLSNRNLSPNVDVIDVPEGCRCVLIQASAIRKWLEDARDANGFGDPFDETFALAFMLLHEMGHIAEEDYVDHEGKPDPDGKIAKQREERADAFAEKALRAALGGSGEAVQVAQSIVGNLNVLAFNVYYANALAQGLSELLCLTSTLYWDMGYSHPNLVFRMMTMAGKLVPSSQTAQIVAEFVDCRGKPETYFETLK